MWPRAVEVMLGLWLLLSPFIFRHRPEATALWITDFVCAGLIIGVALVSFWPRARRVYLLHFLTAAWLIGFGYIEGGHPAEPGYQNDIFVGLTLLLFAIMPNEVNAPPRSWRQYNAERARREPR